MSSLISDFDSLKLSKRFEEAGFPRTQSEVMANTISSLADEHILTKNYFNNRIDRLEEKMDFRFRELEQKITIKLGGMLVVAVSILAALIRLH